MNDHLRLTEWKKDEFCDEFRLHRTLISNGSEAASITYYINSMEEKTYVCYIYHLPIFGASTIWDNWDIVDDPDLDVLKLKANIKLIELGYKLNSL